MNNYTKWTGLNLWECMNILQGQGNYETLKDENLKVGISWYPNILFLNNHQVTIGNYLVSNNKGISIFDDKYFEEHKKEILNINE